MLSWAILSYGELWAMVSYGELRGTGRCVACGHQRWSQTVSHGNLAKSELTLVTCYNCAGHQWQDPAHQLTHTTPGVMIHCRAIFSILNVRVNMYIVDVNNRRKTYIRYKNSLININNYATVKVECWARGWAPLHCHRVILASIDIVDSSLLLASV